MAATTASKRAAEDLAADDAPEQQPDAKKAKLESSAGADGAAAAADAAEADAAAPDAAAAAAPGGEPVTLGYRTFNSGAAAHHYIGNVLKNWNLGQDLNEVRRCSCCALLLCSAHAAV